MMDTPLGTSPRRPDGWKITFAVFSDIKLLLLVLELGCAGSSTHLSLSTNLPAPKALGSGRFADLAIAPRSVTGRRAGPRRGPSTKDAEIRRA
ncbi:MAG: hypothetical protein Kow0092_09920 [Deferrisomatales bacterium]